jgi:hypothetical protein
VKNINVCTYSKLLKDDLSRDEEIFAEKLREIRSLQVGFVCYITILSLLFVFFIKLEVTYIHQYVYIYICAC